MHTTDASAAVANETGNTPIERVYFAWNDALSRNDADGLLKLYAPGAVLESPLVPYLLGTESGVLRGHAQLRPLFQKLRDTKPLVRQYYRTAYLTDGKRLVWEYPRSGPHGEQMDFVEAMQLNDHGLIQRHCVYWVGSASACCSGTNITAEQACCSAGVPTRTRADAIVRP